MNIPGAKILITGGSSGIGKAAAALLKTSGADVAITGRHEGRLAEAARELDVVPICADVSVERDVERTFAIFLARFNALDCLINNAGIGLHKPLIELSEKDLNDVWRVNVLGPMLMARQAARRFIESKRPGTIINIASTAAVRGFEGGTAYVASKFALRGMGECWRAELRKHNVRVVTINPSEVPTAFLQFDRKERPVDPKKLSPHEIAHAIKASLEMDDRGFIPELTVFATNPW